MHVTTKRNSRTPGLSLQCNQKMGREYVKGINITSNIVKDIEHGPSKEKSKGEIEETQQLPSISVYEIEA